MRKRDLVDGVVGPRLEETLDQIFCMQGMTTAEKVDFLMSRNRELRAENHHLHAENAKLRELVRGLWYCTENMSMCEGCLLGEVEGDKLALACEKMMYELGIEVDE